MKKTLVYFFLLMITSGSSLHAVETKTGMMSSFRKPKQYLSRPRDLFIGFEHSFQRCEGPWIEILLGIEIRIRISKT